MLDKVGILICTTENRIVEAEFLKNILAEQLCQNIAIEIVKEGENVAMVRNRYLQQTTFEYICFAPVNYLVATSSTWLNALYECFHRIKNVGMVGVLNHATQYHVSQILTHSHDLIDVHYSSDNVVDGLYMVHVPTILSAVVGFEEDSKYAPYIDFILGKKLQVKEFHCFYIQHHFAFSYRLNDLVIVPRKTRISYIDSVKLLKEYAKQKQEQQDEI